MTDHSTVRTDAEPDEDLGSITERANTGDGHAAWLLGDRCREGNGVRYSPRLAFRWYAQSALAGDRNGQNNLGACYEHGLGCRQSYARAVKWYRKGAEQGMPTAQSNLGHCYWRGHGVPANKDEALRWFRLAAQGGAEGAAKMVERLGGSVPVGKDDGNPGQA